jgi:hypothetical protein
MSVEITHRTDADEWNGYVEQSPQATPLHRHEALALIAEETGTTLHTLVGFTGQEPVGVLPLFEGHAGRSRSSGPRRNSTCSPSARRCSTSGS